MATAGAVSLDDVVGSKNTITISPVTHKSLPVRADDADSVCALAGYQIVESVKTKTEKPSSYYSIDSGGWGGPSIFGTFEFKEQKTDQYFAAIESVTCARKYQSTDVKFE